MTRARLNRRLARAEAAAPPAGPAPPSPLLPSDDSADLASEMARAFADLVHAYHEHFHLSLQEALDRAGENRPDRVAQALAAPPDQVSWSALDAVARADPEKARARWEEVVAAARAELRSGHRAARAIEELLSTCWQRARFLALRAELADAWRPRDALELQLLDQMAQFQALLEHWQGTLTAYTLLSGGGRRRVRDGEPWERPRLSDAEAVEQATAMVERCHRLFLRALRALQDHRRLGPRVVVRHAGQVNIANQQVNVAGPGAPSAKDR